MKFLHTADLQIGSRFMQFGDKADVLRAARPRALRRVLEIAREREVDAVLIAGDLFESNQIEDGLVQEVFEILTAGSGVPVFILPGNHDPLDGPACIWNRRPFADPSARITVCGSQGPFEMAGALVVAAPITQKVSTKDPSLALARAAAAIPEGLIKIGMTHGSLSIEGKHQPNDHPIALGAATRAGLDYLALGHWHKPQSYDQGRLVMPGTPEPDDFGQGSGSVSLVEIPAAGRPPIVTRIDCATFAWQSVTVDLLNRRPSPDVFAAALAGIHTPPASTVLRVEVLGPVATEDRETLAEGIAEATRDYAVVSVDDRSSTVLSESLWKACLREHPLLAQVVADVESARLYNTGRAPTVDKTGLDPLPLDAFQSLCADLNMQPGDLGEGAFDVMIALLTAEVGRTGAEGGAR